MEKGNHTVFLLTVFICALIAGFGGGILSSQLFIKKEWELLTPFASLATIGVALFTAWVAWATQKAVKANEKATRAQILTQLTNAYASHDMLQAMRKLREFKKQHGEKFAEEFVKARE